MEDLGSTAAHHERFELLKGAEQHKNALIEELLWKVETLNTLYENKCLDHERETNANRNMQLQTNHLQGQIRKMERNPFVLVLIDGDGMIFQDYLLQDGEQGGKDAAASLWTDVLSYVQLNLPDLPSDINIVARIYANTKGLAETCARAGIVSNGSTLEDFTRGFTRSKQLFDFVDVGHGKDRADDKLSEVFKLHLYDCHCRHILFGCSHDNGYARLLEELSADRQAVDRITLLEGVPFERELLLLQSTFKKSTKFPALFRSTKISIQQQAAPPQQYGSLPAVTRTASQQPQAPTNANLTPTSWASAATFSPSSSVLSPPLTPTPANTSTTATIRRNKHGQRLDPPLKYDHSEVKRVRALKLCNTHFLRGDCPYDPCTHVHTAKPTKNDLTQLKVIARQAVCKYGTDCDDPKCIYGHRCGAMREGTTACGFGLDWECRFPSEMHFKDVTPVRTLKV
ncbi:MAG: hypothetical protein M1812_005401 [Candelaria pacifica]|nr:MAG: hypothetical protein M1812_005401 [Candelaria pacifica]